jgi:hypothetical protein
MMALFLRWLRSQVPRAYHVRQLRLVLKAAQGSVLVLPLPLTDGGTVELTQLALQRLCTCMRSWCLALSHPEPKKGRRGSVSGPTK